MLPLLQSSHRRRKAVAAGGFSPSDIAGLRLWLKADAGAYTDAGVTLATNGQTVQQWNDQSGNGNHATQGTAGSRPTYVTAIVNSLPVTRFDGFSVDYFDLPNLMSGATAGTAFAALKINLDPPGAEARTGPPLGNWGSNPVANHHPWTDGNIYDEFGSTDRKTAGNPTPTLSSWHQYGVLSAASNWRCRVNGALLFSTTANVVGWSASPKIGRSISGPSYYLDGDIAEVIVYGTALSDADRLSVEGYLSSKYAL